MANHYLKCGIAAVLALLAAGLYFTCEEKTSLVLRLDTSKAEKRFTPLSDALINESIRSGGLIQFRCIVEPKMSINSTDTQEEEYRFYQFDRPRYGGIKWNNCDIALLSQIFKNANPHESFWIAASGILKPYTSRSQIDPNTDPSYAIDTHEIYGYYISPKVSFLKEHALEEK